MNFDKIYSNALKWLVVYTPKLLVGIILLLIGLWLIKLIIKWSQSGMHKRDVDNTVRPFLINLLAVALRVLLILGVIQVIGIPITMFATIVGAFGVAIGLALSGTLQNFASGILILLLKPFIVGDNIITQGLEGTVTSIQIFYTIIRTFDNRSVIVPNSKLSNEVIINISREGMRRLDIDIKFNNGIDIKQIKSVLNAAIDKSEAILKTPERRIGIAALDEDGYHIMINVWVNAHGFYDTRLALQEVILQDIKDAGIAIKGI